MDDVAVDHAASRKRDFADHFKRRRDHFRMHVDRSPGCRRHPIHCIFCGGGHDRSEFAHVPAREHGRCGAALPKPMRPLGNEQALTYPGSQNVLHVLGFRVCVRTLAQDALYADGVHHHMPALDGSARYHRLSSREFRDDFKEIPSCCPNDIRNAQRRRGKCGANRHRPRVW